MYDDRELNFKIAARLGWLTELFPSLPLANVERGHHSKGCHPHYSDTYMMFLLSISASLIL